MLQHQGFGRAVIFVGDDSGLQDKLLVSFEIVGGNDQVGGETASEEIARRTGAEGEAQYQVESEDRCFAH